MELETAKSLISAGSSSINDREQSSIAAKNSQVHKQAGEKIVMNIQSNLESMNTQAGKKTTRHQTDSFMEKLRRRFFDDQEDVSGVSKSVFSIDGPRGSQPPKKYAYSTRNRSI